MNTSRYGSVRLTSTVNSGTSQSFASVILETVKKEKSLYMQVKNLAVLTAGKNKYIILAPNAGIKTLGKLDYLRKQEGFRGLPVYRLLQKQLGQYINLELDVTPL